MGRMNTGKVMVLAGVLFLPGATLAQPILQQRCAVDSQGLSQGEARLEWGRRCALSKSSPAAWFDTGLPAASGGTLRDYIEVGADNNWSGRNMYTSSSYNHEINYSHISLLYLSGSTYQGLDGNGYYKWWRDSTRKRMRPLYPIYGNTYDISSTSNRQLFPHPALTDCNFYFDQYGTQPATGQDFYVNGFCENSSPPPSALTSGVPVGPVSGSAGTARYYTLHVPAGATNVVFETSGGTGDVDLYVRFGAEPDLVNYDCRPFYTGNNETCVVSTPRAGTWYVMLHGPGRGCPGLGGPTGATGDADLYVKYGSAPTTSAFDCRPYLGGNNEVCTFDNPSAGTWHVMLRGWSAYSGVTLTGDF